jgi:TRAP-type C4-dicarboxylate transport system substrate-binding protein
MAKMRIARWILALVCCAAGAACAQELPKTHLKVVGAWDFLSQYKNYEEPFWAHTVSDQSQGRVTAEITPFNKMGLKGTEIIRLMKLGMIDFGTFVLAYGAESDVEVEGIDLVGLSPDVETARRVVDAYLPVLDAFFQKQHGIKVLSIWPYPAQMLFCKSSLKGLSDLKGRKVRVGTRPIGEFVEALGGISVNIPFGDAADAIKAGAIDCAITGSLPGNAAKFHEITHYLYPLPLGWSMAMTAVNLKTWERLDPKVQAFLTRGIADMNDGIWKASATETEEGINCNIGRDPCTLGTKGSMKLVAVSEEDRKLVRNLLVNVVLRRWAERCSTDCVENWNRSIGRRTSIQAKR